MHTKEFNGKFRNNSSVDWRRQVTLVQGESAYSGAAANISVNMSDDVVIQCPCVIEGVCELETLLSQGGMGTAYLGHLIDDPQQRIVLKVPDVSRESVVQLFESECKMLHELHHENIVQFRGMGTFSYEGHELPYLMMKFIPGQSLRQLLAAKGALTWDEVRLVLRDMLSALCCMHEKSLCHRDIKPDNIIYDDEIGRWVLVDFGIAKSVNLVRLATCTMLTQDSGTWDYMAPEQLIGLDTDIRCDIYSLGKVVWELLIGTVPRAGTRLPSAAGLNVPMDVDVLISRMVEHKPEDRYQSPEEALAALNEGAKKIEAWNNTKRRTRRALHWSAWGAGIAAVLALSWKIGDVYQEAQFKKIASGALHPVEMVASLENAHADAFLGWGDSWWKDNMPRIRNKADKELKSLDSEYRSLMRDIESDEHANRMLRLGNFLKKWQDVAPTHKHVRAIQARYEEEQVVALLMRAEALTVGDNKGWADLLVERQKLDKSLSTPQAKEKLSSLDTYVRDNNYNLRLKNIDEAIAQKQYSNAKALIDEAASVYGWTDKLKQARAKGINELWQDYERNVSQYEKNHAYAKALEHIQEFEHQYPHKHEYPVLLEQLVTNKKISIVESWKRSVCLKKEKYNEYYEAMKDFFLNCKGDQSDVYKNELKRFLCWSVHNEIINIMIDGNSDKQRKVAKLLSMKYDECEYAHKSYLDALIQSAQVYLNNPDYHNRMKFWYICQRPPKECVTMRNGPTVYYMKLTSVTIRASDNYYSRTKGGNGADFRVRVYLLEKNNSYLKNSNGGDYVFGEEKRRNQQVMSFSNLAEMYIDTDKYRLKIDIRDTDFFDNAGSTNVWFEFNTKEGSYSGYFKTDNGTEIWWEYTLQ